MTTDHFLKRNAENEPICSCSYRPDILDDSGAAIVGVQWKAKIDVLEHVEAARLAQLAVLHGPARRSPEAPFVVQDAKYPRAGVRQTEEGGWLLSCWNADRVVHVIDEPVFDDRVKAFDYGWLTIGACRDSGTDLNGWPTS
jgi:hypothetical protein